MAPRKLATATCAALALLVVAPHADALDLWRSDDGMRGIEFSPSLKIFFFGIGGTMESPEGYEELWPIPNVGGGALGRLRLRLVADLTPRIRGVVHYEHRPRVLSHGRLLSSVSGALQGDEVMPFRLTPLTWQITSSRTTASPMDELIGSESSTFVWEHELDRVLFVFSLPGADITVGRQAIGWGLGRFWAPLDVFAPMSPTDLDREEKRGVDALRLTLNLNATSYFEVVAVGGHELDEQGDEQITWTSSALAGLLRVNLWSIDWMLMAGKIGRDRVIGAGVNGELFQVGLRGEITATEDENRDRYLRATAGLEFGTSFNLVGIVEYHFNGFGARDPEDYLERAEQLSSRLATGQIAGLGRHYLGLTLSWQPGAWGGLNMVYVQNLTDGSLMLGPSIDYVISDEVRLSASALIPIGKDPAWSVEGGVPTLEPRSEYGMAAQMYVLQLRASI